MHNPALDEYSREGFKPMTEDGSGEEGASSRFGGAAWLAEGTSWPICPNCKKAMQFFVQINLTDAPKAARQQAGEGLIQLFYCTTKVCEDECEAFFAFSKSVVVRRVDVTGAGSVPSPPTSAPFPAKRIVGWTSVVDIPSIQDAEELGLEDEALEVENQDEMDEPADGDKLLGWPHWVQGAEYPTCTECGRSMEYLFQLDSKDNLPYMFGDAGIGHITYCTLHTNILAFGWACT